MSTINKTICNKSPDIPEDKNPDINIGVVHGNCTPFVYCTKPKNILTYDIIVFITGHKINGINNFIFKIIGKP